MRLVGDRLWGTLTLEALVTLAMVFWVHSLGHLHDAVPWMPRIPLDNVLAANRSVTPRLGRGRWDEPAIVSSRDRQELDGLLDKINVHGMASLSDAERDRLRELGKRFGD